MTDQSDDQYEHLPIRLAIRREGEFVNAYHAGRDTMADAMLIGSIRAAILENHPKIWEAWKSLMSTVYAAAIRNVTGVEARMDEMTAPEHERSGRA